MRSRLEPTIRCFARGLFATIFLLAAGHLPQATARDGELPQNPIKFNRDIRPILSKKCFKCHGADENHRQADLRLDVEAGLFGETESGAIPIVRGQPKKSELLRRIVSTEPSERMPPPGAGKEVTPQETALLKKWIAQGADWQGHWAFIAPRRPPLPRVAHSQWPRTPLDVFLLAQMEQVGLEPSPPAEKHTLLRRVTLDLTGLPPTLADLEAFLQDDSPGAYEKVVDRLLKSENYGEQIARFWLDAVRYGDTHGLHLDNYREMWAYRDWVIRAFNQNMPFDQFTIEQMAGDLLAEPTLEQKIASGFNRCNVTTSEGGSIREEVYVRNVVDRTSAFATIFMGLTAGCAVCHNHKFDPLTQRDFYSLFAFFNSLDGNPLDGNRKDHAPVIKTPTAGQKAQLQSLARRIADIEQQVASLAKSGTTDQARKELNAEKDRLVKQKGQLDKSIPTTLVYKERKEPRKAYILVRGEYNLRGDEVPRATPAALPSMSDNLPKDRLGLVKWLLRPEHPLMARVTVNRFWQQLFGVGIVKTSEDFGSQGEWPTHPDLLDWLAVDFRESGWDVKRLMKMIVMSAAYRQTSRATPQLLDKDPQNRLLARGPRYRLDAEMLRDQALALSGLLSTRRGGPSVKPPQPDGIWYAVGYSGSNTVRFTQDHGEKVYRRSVYTFWKRTAPPPAMRIFDAPSRESCRVRRERTNTPLQALLMMNERQYFEAARELARRTIKLPLNAPSQRASAMFRRATCRPPQPDELSFLVGLYQANLAEYKTNPEAAKKLISVGDTPPDELVDPADLASWTLVANLILNLDEVVTKN